MGLVIKQNIQIDSTVLYQWITDKTGEYDVDDNDEGWGDPPDNPHLYQSCLLCYVERQASAGVQAASPVGAQFIFDSGAGNDKETVFQFNYLGDGYYKIWLSRLMVTNDGITSLDGITLLDGHYFYLSGTIYQKVAGVNVEVTDYSAIVADENVVQTMCETLWQGQLSQKRADDYQEYRLKRRGPCNENTVFQSIVMLREDIQGAEWGFKGGLTTDANAVVEDNLDRYNLD